MPVGGRACRTESCGSITGMAIGKARFQTWRRLELPKPRPASACRTNTASSFVAAAHRRWAHLRLELEGGLEQFKEWVKTLRNADRVTIQTVRDAPRQQGAYTLWLDGTPALCLKVGIAGPRHGRGLWERIKFHFSSNPDNSVLAWHTAADRVSEWSGGYDFRDRAQRQAFLATRCYFQAIRLSHLTRTQLLEFERFLLS